MILLVFFGALSLSIFIFELMSGLQRVREVIGRDRVLSGVRMSGLGQPARPSTWQALLPALFPQFFDPARARNYPDVVSRLRRAGYPYRTPGEFYAAAIQSFTLFLALGGLAAGALVALGLPLAAPVAGAILVFLGLRRPYARLKALAQRRARVMHNNMLTGLAVINSLLTAGVGVQEALRRAAGIGGPFCGLLGLLVARLEGEDFSTALASARAHLPDPADIEAELFLRDLQDHFTNSRPVLASFQALQEAVHRSVVEATEARAALVRQRSGLVGILAVLGLVLAIIGPFLGTF